MDFEEYLKSKKIDASAFLKAETELYHSWKKEFEQMHPNSFTVQKLNLINPIRRKYLLKDESASSLPKNVPAPSVRPVIKQKPKF